MRHDIALAGIGVELRPVEMSDAEAIVRLRSETAHTKYLHAVSPDVSLQREWLGRYFEREGDWYFKVVRKRDGSTEGFVGIYDWRSEGERATAEWGRWVLREGSLAATESALLLYRVAFHRLGLHATYCRTVAQNSQVVSFHDRCGASGRREVERVFELRGKWYSAVEHTFDRSCLEAIERALGPMSLRIGQRMNEGR
jgi:RimJ/RimL family protein N-acetyltransferase